MNDLINDKLNEILNLIDNNVKIKRLKELKSDIYNDKEIEKLLNEYKKNNKEYNSKFIDLKKKIIENKKISEYKKIENELFYLVLEINKKLNSLIDKRKCNNESN